MRFGLCCLFHQEPIRFRAATARVMSRFTRVEQLNRFSALCLGNALSLAEAVKAVRRLGIGAFRVTSPLLPLYTHPEVGYALDDLPGAAEIRTVLRRARSYSQKYDIRLSFHPDQFILLSSPRPEVFQNSLQELRYQAMLAELVGADVINIHGGGAYGDKERALDRFKERFSGLPATIRKRLTIENDDITYTPSDLLPVCADLGIPLVYDVHHHRCNPDDLSVDEATRAAIKTWGRAGREPYFHLSSPRDGWHAANPKPHADYVDPRDLPACWMELTVTVDVEAKAKELAVLKLIADLQKG